MELVIDDINWQPKPQIIKQYDMITSKNLLSTFAAHQVWRKIYSPIILFQNGMPYPSTYQYGSAQRNFHGEKQSFENQGFRQDYSSDAKNMR
uniref:Uncharacterized protein n=1 Tax=Romanomermis culicivorax TaxID=13658 RepID=A0A915KT16_ROMCU